jgi:hypothetical protein
MRLRIATGLILACLLTGCTHMGGVVTHVSFNNDGDLVLRKCDALLYWNLVFAIWGEANCREEVKAKLKS